MQKEMEIYYLLLNEVEIIKFEDLQMQIAYHSSEISAQIRKIEQLLNEWSENKWKLSYEIRQTTTTLKDVMLEKVKLSEDYQIIKNNFPDANISDIILKTKN